MKHTSPSRGTKRASILLSAAMLGIMAPTAAWACNDPVCSLSILPTDNQISAVRNGPWNAPSTWSLNRVPEPGDNVIIPAGIRVTWSSDFRMTATSAPLRSIKVDGHLDFVPFWSVRLVVDTIVVSNSGTFSIGSATRPVDRWKTIEIIFAGGDLDRAIDPSLKGRGLISHGKVDIHGQQITPWVKLGEAGISADGRTLTLASTPSNWRKGQSVVITAGAGTEKVAGVEYTLDSWVTKDEVRTISSISGNTVTLDQPLTAGFHDRIFPGMPICVGNMSRNVTFRTADANKGIVHRRGHLMFMTSTDVVVDGVAMLDLGRSDKSRPLTEVPSSFDANLKGRYPLHIHQIGQEKEQPVVVRDCFVRNSPGWGIAVHSSHANVDDNFSYEIFASHFVAEEGDERGSMRRNLAVKSVGDNRHIKDVTVTDTDGKKFTDDGHGGHGFWFQSRNMSVEDNIGVSHEAAFVYFHRHTSNLSIPRANLLTNDRDKLIPQQTSLSRDDTPIVVSNRNTAVASESVLHVIKANKRQGHDIRNKFIDWKGFNISTSAYHVEYTGEYTFINFEAWATNVNSNFSAAFLQGNQSVDMVFVNFIASGWRKPFVSSSLFGGADGFLGNDGLDVANETFVGGQVRLAGAANTLIPFDITKHHFKEMNEPNGGGSLWYEPSVHVTVPYNPDMDLDSDYVMTPPVMDQLTVNVPALQALAGWRVGLVATGDKYDSAGLMPRDPAWPDSMSYYEYWSAGALLKIINAGTYMKNGKEYIDLPGNAGDRVNGKVVAFTFPVEVTR